MSSGPVTATCSPSTASPAQASKPGPDAPDPDPVPDVPVDEPLPNRTGSPPIPEAAPVPPWEPERPESLDWLEQAAERAVATRIPAQACRGIRRPDAPKVVK